jgi:RNA polymerase-binding protein DksA
MTKTAKFSAYRKALHAMRKRLDEEVGALRDEASHDAGGENAGDLSVAPIHPADQGSQEMESAVNVGLAENEAFLRNEVEDALARLDAGTFGRCEECGGKIDEGRLKAVPYARWCIDCANDGRG